MKDYRQVINEGNYYLGESNHYLKESDKWQRLKENDPEEYDRQMKAAEVYRNGTPEEIDAQRDIDFRIANSRIVADRQSMLDALIRKSLSPEEEDMLDKLIDIEGKFVLNDIDKKVTDDEGKYTNSRHDDERMSNAYGSTIRDMFDKL